MKRIIPLLLLCSGLSLHAQDSTSLQKPLHFNPALSAQLMQDRSFLGLNVGVTSLFNPGHSANFRYGYSLSTGLLHDKVSDQEDQQFRFEFFSQRLSLYYLEEVKGDLFWIPAEASFLIGYQENFLELGAGLHWVQFKGSRYIETDGNRYTYQTQLPTYLGSLSIGYRFQPRERGSFFALCYKPLMNLENELRAHSYQVSLGYSF